MISDIDKKRLSKKYPLKVPGAYDMHHYLRPLLQKCPGTIVYMLAQIIV